MPFGQRRAERCVRRPPGRSPRSGWKLSSAPSQLEYNANSSRLARWPHTDGEKVFLQLARNAGPPTPKPRGRRCCSPDGEPRLRYFTGGARARKPPSRKRSPGPVLATIRGRVSSRSASFFLPQSFPVAALSLSPLDLALLLVPSPSQHRLVLIHSSPFHVASSFRSAARPGILMPAASIFQTHGNTEGDPFLTCAHTREAARGF